MGTSKKYTSKNKQTKEAAETSSWVIEQPRTHMMGLEIRQFHESPGVLMNCFAQKSIEQMLRKHMGLSVQREIKKPSECIDRAIIRNVEGVISLPPTGVKKAMCTAALGLKGLSGKRLKSHLYVRGGSIPLVYEGMESQMHMVRLGGQGKQPDVRFRPCFTGWSARFILEFPDLYRHQTIIDLLQRAGRVGLCEWRPECGGNYGMFEVVRVITEKKEVNEVLKLCAPSIKPLVIPEWAMDADISPALLARIINNQTAEDDDEELEGVAEVPKEMMDADISDEPAERVMARGKKVAKPKKNGKGKKLFCSDEYDEDSAWPE